MCTLQKEKDKKTKNPTKTPLKNEQWQKVYKPEVQKMQVYFTHPCFLVGDLNPGLLCVRTWWVIYETYPDLKV